MFFVFYMSSIGIRSFAELKDFTIKIMPNAELNIPQMPQKSQVIKNSDDLLDFWCDYFSLSLRNGGQHVEFRSQDYGMNFKYQFWFDIYTASPDWIEGMLTFIGKIIKKYDGDCVLESNGDTPIVMRKDGIVIVDDSKLRGTQRFPFHHLGIEVEEGNLEIV